MAALPVSEDVLSDCWKGGSDPEEGGLSHGASDQRGVPALAFERVGGLGESLVHLVPAVRVARLDAGPRGVAVEHVNPVEGRRCLSRVGVAVEGLHGEDR
jgi:hypothetical protein